MQEFKDKYVVKEFWLIGYLFKSNLGFIVKGQIDVANVTYQKTKIALRKIASPHA
jgi:hypothetical protein